MGVGCLEEVRLDVIDEGGEDAGDAGDDVGDDLVELERLDDPVSVGIEDPEQALDDALEPVAHREVLVGGVGELDERVDDNHDFILGDESIAVGV